MRRRISLRVLVLAGLTAATLVAGGAASAYWVGSGNGIGGGATGTTAAVTLSPGTPASSLYPGALTDVVLTISNPNPGTVRVPSLALDTTLGTGGLSADAGHSGCGVSALNFTTQTNGGAGWTVPAKVGGVDGTLSVTLTNALSMGVNAQGACQGASFTVYLAAGP